MGQSPSGDGRHRQDLPAQLSLQTLTHLLAVARDRLVAHQAELFERAGGRVVVVGREPGRAESFGERLARLVAEENAEDGLIVFGAGAVPLLRRDDVEALVTVAARGGRAALTNNRYSSDICAIVTERGARLLN